MLAAADPAAASTSTAAVAPAAAAAAAARLEALLQLVLRLALGAPDACQAAGCGAARALMAAAARARVGPLHLLTPMLMQVRVQNCTCMSAAGRSDNACKSSSSQQSHLHDPLSPNAGAAAGALPSSCEADLMAAIWTGLSLPHNMQFTTHVGAATRRAAKLRRIRPDGSNLDQPGRAPGRRPEPRG